MKPSRTKLLVAAIVLIVIAVGSAVAVNKAPGGKSPGAVSGPGPAAQVDNFERALAKGDCAAVKKIVAAPEDVDCGSIEEASESMKDVDLDAAVYRLIDSGKDYATVRLEIDGEESNLDLVKDGGSWFVIFDTAA